MNIVVCVKQVPLVGEVSIDPDTKRLRREGVESGMNPFDLYAVEEGLRIRERIGGRVTVMSMGPGSAEKTIREALAMGADHGILLSDPAFAGSDTWATSYILTKAIRRFGQVDLVLCGKQAVDGDTAQVGPGIAAHLDWPHVACVFEAVNCDNSRILVKRMQETGHSEVELQLPALLTVVKDLNQPRVPTLKRCRAARAAQLEIWSSRELATTEGGIGLAGSPTRVVTTAPPPPRSGRTVCLAGTAQESARALLQELRMRSMI